MKKFNLLAITFAVLTILLAACGGADDGTNKEREVDTDDAVETEVESKNLAYEPEDINEDIDVCEVCAMAVSNNEHAAQIVLQNDKALKFDDIGCLHGWIDENGEDDIGAEFVRDFNSEEWIQLNDATFVYDETIETPMAYGIISFENSADAESYVEEEGIGKVLSSSDLADHEWTMNKEMMMSDDGHDHDEEDDEENGK